MPRPDNPVADLMAFALALGFAGLDDGSNGNNLGPMRSEDKSARPGEIAGRAAGQRTNRIRIADVDLVPDVFCAPQVSDCCSNATNEADHQLVEAAQPPPKLRMT